MSTRTHLDFLDDIRSAAGKAVAFTSGMDYAAFAADERTVFAVVRALEIVGEAAKRIPSVVRDRHPQVPWRTMSRMRDKLIHDYTSVNLEVVWQTVMDDLPGLGPQLEHVILAESGGPTG